MIPADQMPAFKAEVAGSDLTKIALIEALKKKYVSIFLECFGIEMILLTLS